MDKRMPSIYTFSGRKAADVWSLVLVMYQMANARRFYYFDKTLPKQDIANNILKGDYYPSNYPYENNKYINEFLDSAIDMKPDTRETSEELLKRFSAIFDNHQ